MRKDKGFCTMSIKEFMPPYAEEISKSVMELYERAQEIEADIAKRTLTYAYECWKQGIYYIVKQTEFTDLRPTGGIDGQSAFGWYKDKGRIGLRYKGRMECLRFFKVDGRKIQGSWGGSMSKNDKARGAIRVSQFGFIKNPRSEDIFRAYNDYVVGDKSPLSAFGTNSYCPVLGGVCKYVMDGKCTAAVCERMGK